MALQELIILILGTTSIALIYTFLEPDHYLPPAAMFLPGKWSHTKTIYITLLCGFAFLLSSLLISTIGIALGLAIKKYVALETFRGTLAAWVIIVFGLAYFDQRLALALLNLQHEHWHVHSGEVVNIYDKHFHTKEHPHTHEKESLKILKPWKLFLAFFFHPCKPFIAIVIYPTAKDSILSLGFLTAIFVGVTIASLLAIALKPDLGIKLSSYERLDRYRNALAGATIFLCGIALLLL